MLISMPTGTSTILGAFQAIRLSFLNRTTYALPNKVPRNEKFASGIFYVLGLCVLMLRRKRSVGCEMLIGSKWREIKPFAVAGTRKKGDVEANQ